VSIAKASVAKTGTEKGRGASIKVTALTKLYDQQKAVNNISFELAQGEIVGFLGPNGAGKSTTMKIITGYLPPTSGKVTVCGFDVEEQPLEVRKRVGYLPEANPLYFEMYVREYLEFTAGIHKLGKGTAARIEEMIQLTGLSKEAHKKIGALSKGYKQRVGLAQAMLHDPEVLILDEPTSGLDPNQIVEIRDLIKSFGSSKTILLSTHIMQEVQAMCNRVIIINNGQIVADDSIEHLQKANAKQDILLVSFEQAIDVVLFKELTNLARYEHLDGNRWKFVAKNTDALRKEVMQWALKHDMHIASMQAQTESLEDVFRNLTKK
jgi:ABC-2 type transport system ATP-binding protein